MSLNKRLMSSQPAPFVASENFKVVTYTGNDGTQNIDVGFKPDLVWIKNRNNSSDSTFDHSLFDSQRGTFRVRSNSDGAANDYASHYGGITDNGFQVKNGLALNDADGTYVAWCWKANGGTTSTNTDGANIDSTVQVNANAGFSIVKFTGTGNATHTVGHGLGVTPDIILLKDTSNTRNWMMHISSAPSANQPYGGNLDLNNAFNTNSGTNGGFGTPTSSVITFTNGSGSINNMNANNAVIIAYCFKSIDGFSKIGAYVGNGSANGPIVETGFEPAFLLGRKVSGDNWWLLDNKRNTSNPRNTGLFPNLTQEDLTGGYSVDFLSNGFQLKTNDGAMNANSSDYVYIAFAADPDEEAPTLASSFNIETYTGTGSSQSITGLGFQPNFVWIKSRTNTLFHNIINSSIGASYVQYANNNSAGETNANVLSSFDTGGFTVGSDNSANQSGQDFVAWTWKADDNEPTINENGSIDSIVSANANAGMSIVKFNKTTNSSTASTFGHGLSAAPNMIILKRTDGTEDWYVYHTSLGNAARVQLNSDAAQTTGTNVWGQTNPTATVFTVESFNAGNAIAYCFHDVAGYQKFGSYAGNGTSQSINVGFKPDFVMLRKYTSGQDWMIFDSVRDGNPKRKRLEANNSDAEVDETTNINFTSTGFEFTSDYYNDSGQSSIYWAVAKNVPSNTTLVNSFRTVTYTGNGAARSITGTGFKPDLVWIKCRNNTRDHNLTDSVRGVTHPIYITTQGELTNSTFLTSFDTDGFSLGNQAASNNNGETFVAWAWKAGNTWQSNLDGTIGSTVNANTANGFSIVKYTGTGSAATIGHGLSSTPEMIILKNLDASVKWRVYHSALGATKYLNFSDSDAAGTASTVWNDTTPTSTVFSVGTDSSVSGNGNEIIAYCFHSVSGYNKISSYSGTGSSNAITGLGFKPDWIMIKEADGVDSWEVYDSVRGDDKVLYPNGNNAEGTGSNFTSFDSDGFTVSSATSVNENGKTYIYMAFRHVLQPQAGFMSFLVVAGGGSGGRTNAGGGGAGGLRTSYGGSSGGGASAESDITLAAGTYTITVGAGGAALTSNGVGNNGEDSSIAAAGLTTITSVGGGGGFGSSGASSAGSGGSGGGAGTNTSNSASGFGSGTTNQGFAGGARNAAANTYAGGGGGGASAAGQTSPGQETGGAGGAGLAVKITGSSVTYAGGGGGGGGYNGGAAGAGGAGGGTAGGYINDAVSDATANTGGGSGGTRNAVTAGSGGSGVVILRLLTSEYSGTTTGSPTVTTDGDYKVLKYTSSGTYVHS